MATFTLPADDISHPVKLYFEAGSIDTADREACSYGPVPVQSDAITLPGVSQSPSQVNMSTGDTKQIPVAVSPSSISSPTYFAGTGAPTSNPDSCCAVSLTIPGKSGSGSISSSVTASPEGDSGVFKVTAFADGSQTGNSTMVNVPSQVVVDNSNARAACDVDVFMTNSNAECTAKYLAGPPDSNNYGGSYGFAMSLKWYGGNEPTTAHSVSGLVDCPAK